MVAEPQSANVGAMTGRVGFCCVALLALALAAGARAAPYHPPRTPWGAPDLQGTWSNGSLTRLERLSGVPARIGKGDDLAAIEQKVFDNVLPDDPLGNKEAEWWEKGHLAVIDG